MTTNTNPAASAPLPANFETIDVPTITNPWNGKKRPSLLMLLDERIQTAVQKLPIDYLEMSEAQLDKEIRLKTPGHRFSRTHSLLKIAFWDEYKRAAREKTTMLDENIYFGICSPEYFERFVVQDELYLAWLVTPPTDELVLQKELLLLGMKKMREAFEAPIIIKKKVTTQDKKTGEKTTKIERLVNVPLLKEIHAIFRTLQDRVHGSMVHKHMHDVKQTTMQLNVNATPEQVASGQMPAPLRLDSPTLTLQELEAFDKQLERIEKKIEKYLPPDEVA